MAKWLAFAAWTLILGWGFLFINIASDQLDAIEQTVIRAGIATLVLWVYASIVGMKLPINKEALIAFAILGIFNRSLTFMLMAWSQELGVPSGLSSLFIATNPLFSMIIAHFIFADERMSGTKVFGVVLGFLGILILASRSLEGDEVVGSSLLGQAAIVLAAFLFASTTVYTRQVMHELKISPFTLAWGATTVGFGFMLVSFFASIAFGNSPPNLSGLQTDTIISVLILSVFNSMFALLLANYVIRELGASRAAMQAYIVPLIALALGAIFLDEIIDLRVIVAAAVILGGLAIANLGQRHPLVRTSQQPT